MAGSYFQQPVQQSPNMRDMDRIQAGMDQDALRAEGIVSRATQDDGITNGDAWLRDMRGMAEAGPYEMANMSPLQIQLARAQQNMQGVSDNRQTKYIPSDMERAAAVMLNAPDRERDIDWDADLGGFSAPPPTPRGIQSAENRQAIGNGSFFNQNAYR